MVVTGNSSCSYRGRGRETEVQAPELEGSLNKVIVTALERQSSIHQTVSDEGVRYQVSQGHIHSLLHYVYNW